MKKYRCQVCSNVFSTIVVDCATVICSKCVSSKVSEVAQDEKKSDNPQKMVDMNLPINPNMAQSIPAQNQSVASV